MLTAEFHRRVMERIQDEKNGKSGKKSKEQLLKEEEERKKFVAEMFRGIDEQVSRERESGYTPKTNTQYRQPIQQDSRFQLPINQSTGKPVFEPVGGLSGSRTQREQDSVISRPAQTTTPIAVRGAAPQSQPISVGTLPSSVNTLPRSANTFPMSTNTLPMSTETLPGQQSIDVASSRKTYLTPQEESLFQIDFQKLAKETGIDTNPDNPLHKYDYRGAWKAGKLNVNEEQHFPSEFKDVDHPNRFVGGVDTTGKQIGVTNARQGTEPISVRGASIQSDYEEKSFLGGFINSLTSWDTEDIPYYGSGKEAVGYIGAVYYENKVKKGTATAEDKKKLANFYKEEKKQTKLKENTGYWTGEIIKGSLRFMGELLPAVISEIVTFGVAPTGDMMILSRAAKLGAKKTLQKMMKDKAYKATVITSIKNIAKKESILLTKQFAITAPTNITLGTAQRMLGQVDLDTGQVLEDGQPISEAFTNALTGHAVELITERGGGVTGKVLKQLTSPVRKVVVKTAIFQSLKKAMPGSTNAQIVSLLKKTGFNGPIGEWFEERDADVLNQALYSVGLGDQEFKGLTREQIIAEIVAFILMGAGAKLISNENVGGRLLDTPTQDDSGNPPPPGDKQTQQVEQPTRGVAPTLPTVQTGPALLPPSTGGKTYIAPVRDKSKA